eukprot:1177606-Prorocentrum_minimum.AAC.1
MGIVDDYYGGYANLAMHTDEDGDVDWESAYYSAAGLDYEDGYFSDEYDDDDKDDDSDDDDDRVGFGCVR